MIYFQFFPQKDKEFVLFSYSYFFFLTVTVSNKFVFIIFIFIDKSLDLVHRKGGNFVEENIMNTSLNTHVDSLTSSA